jgi:hypothetical protein
VERIALAGNDGMVLRCAIAAIAAIAAIVVAIVAAITTAVK